MATSYANPGGSGDRTATVLVTAVGGNGPAFYLVNGNTADNNFYFPTSTGCSVEFWFHAKVVIDEATYRQQNASAMGTWQWQASNDRTTWTTIGATFALGGTTTQTLTTLAGNTTAYSFYRMVQTGGVTSSSPYVHEFTFKIEDGGTTSYLNPRGRGDRTALITVTSSGITWSNGTDKLVNGVYTTQTFWNASAVAGHWIQFDLAGSYLLQEARFWFSGSGSNEGVWKLQGSPDASAWTDLTGSVTLGLGTAVTPTASTVTYLGGFATNVTAYRYYRLLGVSGSRTTGPYEQEMEFMVAAGVAATGTAAAQTYVWGPV